MLILLYIALPIFTLICPLVDFLLSDIETASLAPRPFRIGPTAQEESSAAIYGVAACVSIAAISQALVHSGSFYYDGLSYPIVGMNSVYNSPMMPVPAPFVLVPLSLIARDNAPTSRPYVSSLLRTTCSAPVIPANPAPPAPTCVNKHVHPIFEWAPTSPVLVPVPVLFLAPHRPTCALPPTRLFHGEHMTYISPPTSRNIRPFPRPSASTTRPLEPSPCGRVETSTIIVPLKDIDNREYLDFAFDAISVIIGMDWDIRDIFVVPALFVVYFSLLAILSAPWVPTCLAIAIIFVLLNSLQLFIATKIFATFIGIGVVYTVVGKFNKVPHSIPLPPPTAVIGLGSVMSLLPQPVADEAYVCDPTPLLDSPGSPLATRPSEPNPILPSHRVISLLPQLVTDEVYVCDPTPLDSPRSPRATKPSKLNPSAKVFTPSPPPSPPSSPIVALNPAAAPFVPSRSSPSLSAPTRPVMIPRALVRPILSSNAPTFTPTRHSPIIVPRLPSPTAPKCASSPEFFTQKGDSTLPIVAPPKKPRKVRSKRPGYGRTAEVKAGDVSTTVKGKEDGAQADDIIGDPELRI